MRAGQVEEGGKLYRRWKQHTHPFERHVAVGAKRVDNAAWVLEQGSNPAQPLAVIPISLHPFQSVIPTGTALPTKDSSLRMST